MQREQLLATVRAASQRGEVIDAVRELYGSLQAEIDRRRPVCQISGRCCRFDEYGHRLYVTTMELAAFFHDLQTPPPPPPAGDGRGCPFQINKLCSVHAIRPMGCRLFFCDATAADWQQQQYELFHARLKRMHESLGVPYAYLEWRKALEVLREEG
jgi:Fe-S-cluster containining protein